MVLEGMLYFSAFPTTAVTLNVLTINLSRLFSRCSCIGHEIRIRPQVKKLQSDKQ
jgi:hypothetical protein